MLFYFKSRKLLRLGGLRGYEGRLPGGKTL